MSSGVGTGGLRKPGMHTPSNFTPRNGGYRHWVKRPMDLIVVLLLLPIALPLILIAAALVSLDGGAPFYAQKRVGRRRKAFTIWKLRTMVPEADKILVAYLEANPDAAREWAITQKLKHDPRITPLGALLRKTSLDELPQLWNVLKGDMSLIGPRPMMLDQTRLYPGTAYYDLRPGITGPWQVSDRNACSFAKRADYDEAYKHDLSLAVDLGILCRTVGAVVRGTGC
ncbi:MAG: sugar transferase [Pseudomonadota bacterium]